MAATQPIGRKRWDIMIVVSGLLVFIDIGFPLLGVPLWGVALSVLVVVVAAAAVTELGPWHGLLHTPRLMAAVGAYVAVTAGTLLGIVVMFTAPLAALVGLAWLVMALLPH